MVKWDFGGNPWRVSSPNTVFIDNHQGSYLCFSNIRFTRKVGNQIVSQHKVTFNQIVNVYIKLANKYMLYFSMLCAYEMEREECILTLFHNLLRLDLRVSVGQDFADCVSWKAQSTATSGSATGCSSEFSSITSPVQKLSCIINVREMIVGRSAEDCDWKNNETFS